MPSPFDAVPRSVRVRDMTLRDGLQSLPAVLPTSAKVEIYDALVRAGVRDLQVTSFVNPARVPQLGDAEDLWRALAGRPERRSVLVANMRGYDRARAAGADEIEAVVSVSEAYNAKNARRTVRQSLDEIAAMARGAETPITIGLANCYHCVLEGRIDRARVMAVVGELAGYGVREIGLSDTTGYATPDQVHALSAEARAAFPEVTFGAHLHDTRGRGVANAVAALQAGVAWLDTALAGLGGSPFAPGVGGNLSTEAVVDTLAEMGVATGVDTAAIVEAGKLVGRHAARQPEPAAA